MKLGKILFATDFSEGSEAALQFASLLAAATNASLLIQHTDDTTPGMVFGDVGYGYVPDVDDIARREYDRLRQIVPSVDGVDHEHIFTRGVAAEEILSTAKREHVDLIVIGTHGRSGVSRLLMGSVAEAVVRRATCPVLTVKQPIDDAERPKEAGTLASSTSQRKRDHGR